MPIPFSLLQVKYLSEHIKVNGKAGALGDVVKVTADGNKIVIASTSSFSKRYFKYLTKKYLQKNEIRDFIRVIATTKYGYELRFLNLAGAEEDAE